MILFSAPLVTTELVVSSGLWFWDRVPVTVRGAGFGAAMGQHTDQPIRKGHLLFPHLHPHDDF